MFYTATLLIIVLHSSYKTSKQRKAEEVMEVGRKEKGNEIGEEEEAREEEEVDSKAKDKLFLTIIIITNDLFLSKSNYCYTFTFN